jgi:nucleotide-binding universal stress UspA family protein
MHRRIETTEHELEGGVLEKDDVSEAQRSPIVVGVADTEGGRAAMAWALTEARVRHAPIRAVHAWHYPFDAVSSGSLAPPLAPEELERAAEAIVDAVLTDIAADAGAVHIDRSVEYGATVRVLLDAAGDAGLLVVGSRGRGRMTGLLLGSVGQYLVTHARCPVVVVHAGQALPEPGDEDRASGEAGPIHPGTLEEISEDECLALLAGHEVGRLAVVRDGQPLVFPVNYVLDRRTVAFRSDPGTKLDWADLGRVAFQIDAIDTARHEGWSVLVQGVGRDITDGIDSWSEHLRGSGLTPWAEGQKSHWVAISTPRFSGRRLRHPGTHT